MARLAQAFVAASLLIISGQHCAAITVDDARAWLIDAANVTDAQQLSHKLKAILDKGITSEDVLMLWDNFKQYFGKLYDSEEDVQRIKNFVQNLIDVVTSNLQTTDDLWYWLSGTIFSDFSRQELATNFLGFQPPSSKRLSRASSRKLTAAKGSVSSVPEGIPLALDWRQRGVLTPVKDQGQCNTCYIFASTAGIESAYLLNFKARGTPLDPTGLDLSEEMVHACGSGRGYGDCQPGYMEAVLDYVQKTGQVDSSLYPYTGTQARCQPSLVSSAIAEGRYVQPVLGGYKKVAASKEALIKALQIQPIVMGMWVPIELYQLKGGIMAPPKQGSGYKCDFGHAMLYVGYNLTGPKPYWIVRNSWGPDWAEAGYFRLAMSDTGYCDQYNWMLAPALDFTVAGVDLPGMGGGSRPSPSSPGFGGGNGTSPSPSPSPSPRPSPGFGGGAASPSPSSPPAQSPSPAPLPSPSPPPSNHSGILVRLRGGRNSLEGRLEVKLNGSSGWGVVCDTKWGYKDAAVVCRQLGLPYTGAKGPRSSMFGGGSLPVVLDGVKCDGSESSLAECDLGAGWGSYKCNRKHIAGVACSK